MNWPAEMKEERRKGEGIHRRVRLVQDQLVKPHALAKASGRVSALRKAAETVHRVSCRVWTLYGASAHHAGSSL